MAKPPRCVRPCAVALPSLKGLLGLERRRPPSTLSHTQLTLDRYLGVCLAKVILASQLQIPRKPILVVCTTNHALDSFLEGIRDAGISKLARLGKGSKENWTQAIQLSKITRSTKKTTFEKTDQTTCYTQLECQLLMNSTKFLS